MALEIKMPALSPTMEEGTLARWLIKVGDTVSSGDIMAEIETDKATMEFEAVDEGVLAAIAVEEGTENVAVGTVIAMLAEDGEDVDDVSAPSGEAESSPESEPEPESDAEPTPEPAPSSTPAPDADDNDYIKASPLARRIAANEGVDLGGLEGSGPDGRIVKADVEAAIGSESTSAPVPSHAAKTSGDRIIASPLAKRVAAEKGISLSDIRGTGPGGRIIERDVDSFEPQRATAQAETSKDSAQRQEAPASAGARTVPETGAPYDEEKVTSVRKVIAKRLTESKQTVPHYYLTMDIRLDPLLSLRKELNEALEADGVKLSVNDLLIKALAKALIRVPKCNVSFHGDTMRRYSRADISVAVAAPSGLITPIIAQADTKSLAVISKEMKELAGKAREGKLQPHEYQGGTASLSNLGMFGIKQFDAVINPPQGMILAVGAGQQAPYVVDGELSVATVMHASGSFDHRAIDGAEGAELMQALKDIIEKPMGLVV